MSMSVFKTARKLANKTAAYFRYIEGEYHLEAKLGKEEKVYSREPEPATFTGFALFIGFNSRQALEAYEQNGEFGYVVSRGRLQIEALYEKKLHQQSSSGAVFALKNLGCKEKSNGRLLSEKQVAALQVEIVDNGLKTAENEAEVLI